MSNLIV